MPHLGGPSQRLTQSAGMNAYPTWGPNGESVYNISDGGQNRSETWGIWRIAVDRKTARRKEAATEVFVRNGSKFLHPKFVAGGKNLTYAAMEPKTDIWVGESDALEKGTIAVRGLNPVLSPDGQTIYFVGERPDQQGVFAINRSGDKSSLRKITDLKPLSRELSLSPDGQLLALLGHDGRRLGIFLTPTAGGAARLVDEFATSDAVVPVWSPDGNWLAYTVDKQLIRMARDGRLREPLATVYRWQGRTIRWSPDGKHLAGFADKSPSATNEMSGVYVCPLPIRPEKRSRRTAKSR
ncbi:MAG: hypothetical protein EXS36_17685 [Pedosphaera sp.]|nr:hypothetical protein [Pedosphaera sp.]